MYVLFFLFWILLADRVTAGVCLTGAVISVLVWLLGRRVLGFEDRLRGLTLEWFRSSLAYLGYLLVEILKASFVVMQLVYTRGKETRPALIYFHTDLKSDQARAALANSITLTAGTITVEADRGAFCVHTLDLSLAEGIENSGFEQQLMKLER